MNKIVPLIHLILFGWKRWLPLNMNVGDAIETPDGKGRISHICEEYVTVAGIYDHSSDFSTRHAPPGYRMRGVDYEAWRRRYSKDGKYQFSRIRHGKRDTWLIELTETSHGRTS